MNLPDKRIAYFSIKIALDLTTPKYSGGLSVLADNMLSAAAE
jgi:hypothetical protein